MGERTDGRRRYRNPPIDEAVCEFRFPRGEDWDLTIPGKLQAALASEYDGRTQNQESVDLEFELKGKELPSLHYGQKLAKVLLFTGEGTRAVGVGPGVLSIHMLRPYQGPASSEAGGWDEFRPRIGSALDAYWSIADPPGVHRISVRYINRIVIPKPSVTIEHYLRYAVPSVPGLPEQVKSYMSRTNYRHDDATRLILTQGTVPRPSGEVGFLLDIDVRWNAQPAVSKAEALVRTDMLRRVERNAFEAVITDAAREVFDAD